MEDVERLFSDTMVAFMEKNGYSAEAKHLAVIRNWRKACDERGLSEEERARFNQELLDYLLDQLCLGMFT